MGVILPVYNHSQSLPRIVNLIPSVLPVVVVDDGSSPPIPLTSFSRPVWLCRHPENLGKGRALETGICQAAQLGWDYAITLDADGQHPPQLLSSWQHWVEIKGETSPCLFLGVRRGMGKAPWKSQLGLFLANLLFWLVAGVYLPDTQCGLRAYPVSWAVRHFPLSSPGYAWETEILLLALRERLPLWVMPFSPVYPQERVSHYRFWQDSLEIGKLLFRKKLSFLRGSSFDRPPHF